MRTRKETISSQTNREGKTISRKISGCNLSRKISAFGNSVANVMASSWKTTETSVQDLFAVNYFASTSVINITGNQSEKSVPSITGSRDVIDRIQSEKIGRREREMKAVMSNIFRSAIFVAISLSMVLGQGAPKLDIHIEDQKVNLTEAEKLDASKITYAPGDTLRYVITASNIGTGLMTEPEIIDPVPTGVTYVAESAMGDDTEITFSMNQGGTYMAWPPFYTVRNSKGILVKREATPEMISHIKWSVGKDLQPGETSTMEFLVVVNK